MSGTAGNLGGGLPEELEGFYFFIFLSFQLNLIF
jgi:hypothetical protein